ncbi:hypothetical protein AcetOrient_orf00263p (plasmid) [Acetobacter orientalis]|uniref:Uncharacterized protein n=1 Tax=Acetobacter orientalis TaxID=146474 RepID=A0A2Z5ZN40_9PROT|nr:hypothetical protein AcetOrient_orf00263p [Acetobacter orientalis]
MTIRIKSHVTLALGATALILPALTGIGHAQAVDEVMQNATGHINTGWGYLINSVGFVGGGGLLIGSLFSAYKKHNGMGGNNTGYGKILAAAGVGTCLLALPFYERTASMTVFGAKASITGEQQTIKFSQ